MTSHVYTESLKEKFPIVLEECRGNVTLACQVLKVPRCTYYKWKERDAKFATACNDVVHTVHDYVENALMKRIDQGSDACIIFYLKTKAKERGYVERVEQTGINGEPLNIFKLTEKDNEIIERAIQRRIEEMNGHH